MNLSGVFECPTHYLMYGNINGGVGNDMVNGKESAKLYFLLKSR